MTTLRIRPMVAILAATLVAGVLVSSAVASPVSHPRTPTRSTKVVEGIGAGRWSPTTVRISPGDSIKWKAVSNQHTVTAFGGNWSFDQNLSIGHPVTFRFTHAGTYHFRCRFHSSLVNGVCSGMCGKVVVS